MILSCQNISKAFGTDVILNHASFHIEEKEKVAVVGSNGAGKTTLLRIIMHELDADEGSVTIAKGKTIGCLAQHEAVSSEHTIYEELLEGKSDILELEREIRSLEQRMKQAKGAELSSVLTLYHRANTAFEEKNGYACQSELTGVLRGLGFSKEEFDKPISSLSGGQKTRVALGKLLLQRPDILLLDEPTNHLDIVSVAWLETFLINYEGAVLVVSHDRYFLNRVVTKVVEVDSGRVTTFPGNYNFYATEKAKMREADVKAYLKQQQEIHRQEEVITRLRSFNREKSLRRAESREKMLDRIERIDRPTGEPPSLSLTLSPRFPSGNDVLTVLGLSKSFASNALFRDLNFTIRRGEKVALIGNNGVGKTTLLKIINQVIPADTGSFTLGSRVKIGYYDQEQQTLHREKTILEEISDAFPTLTMTQIRNTLAAFLFTGEDVFKCIRDLSGGERGRVSLAKLMLSEANFLILDEPTNHLDILSKEILEQALNRYTGTVLYVSHDRYFVNQTASRILELTGGMLVNYIGNYDYYLEKKEELTRIYAPDAEEKADAHAAESEGKRSWQQQKEAQAKQRKRENDLKKTEERIFALEERDRAIDEEMTHEEVFTDMNRCLELGREKEGLQAELADLYETWESLSEPVPD